VFGAQGDGHRFIADVAEEQRERVASGRAELEVATGIGAGALGGSFNQYFDERLPPLALDASDEEPRALGYARLLRLLCARRVNAEEEREQGASSRCGSVWSRGHVGKVCVAVDEISSV